MNESTARELVPDSWLERRWLRAVAALFLGTCLGLLAGEGLVRFLIFSNSEFAMKWGGHLRWAPRFTDVKADSDYFKLRHIWRDRKRSPGEYTLHPKLGWVGVNVRGKHLDHVDRVNLNERRPLLMYGDSYTACMVPSDDCWQGLLEKSEFNKKLALMNYGTKGYGLGQTFVMVKESIGRWLEQDPVVVVGILVDDDLDRVVFDFRSGPKPVFGVEEGKLTIDYPEELTLEQWMEEHPVTIKSYLAAFVQNGTHILPRAWTYRVEEGPALIERKKNISRVLLTAIRDELEGQGLDYFVIVFQGPHAGGRRHQKAGNWRHPFLHGALDELEIPWVSAEKSLRRHLKRNEGRRRADYFIPDGEKGGRHYNKLGNEAVMISILRALGGRFDGAIQRLERNPAGIGKKR